MADENDTGGREALEFGEGGARVKLALTCSMQSEALVQALVVASRNQSENLDVLTLAIGHRLLQLSGIACRALSDTIENVDRLYYELHGEHMPASVKEVSHG